MNAHEIDYHIYGEEMQYVEIELDPQEAVVAEAGSFMMMDQDIKMDTIFGDGSNQDTGVLGKLFSAGKRLLTGESLFMTAFLNIGQGKKQVSFAERDLCEVRTIIVKNLVFMWFIPIMKTEKVLNTNLGIFLTNLLHNQC